MKNLIFLLFIVGCNSSKQSRIKELKSNVTDSYLVTFQSEMSIELPVLADNAVNFVQLDKNGDTLSAEKTQINVSPFFKFIQIGFLSHCKARTNSSVIYFDNFTSSNNFYNNGSYPDSIVLKDDRWKSYKSNNSNFIEFNDASFTKTHKKKYILGFECEQYSNIGNISLDTTNTFVWVTTELPRSIIPVAGLRPMVGAILEYENLSSKAHLIATNITSIPD